MTWSNEQKKTFFAAWLGWTLDSFDFFLLVFILADIANTFHKSVSTVAFAITLTLACRPIGALLFGRLADRHGRKPILMISIGLYALFGCLSGLSPNLATLLIFRALFGCAMGGEWGVGAALVMESAPIRSRGLVSGALQAGYPTGFLLASIAYNFVYPWLGWRGMLFLGVLPAFLVLYIRSKVSESMEQNDTKKTSREGKSKISLWSVIRMNWRLTLYAIILMASFNFLSHGSGDMYPTFLQVQRHLDVHKVALLAIIMSAGSIIGAPFFGFLSERIGRRTAIGIAAILTLPAVVLCLESPSLFTMGIGAALVGLFVQGAWGVVPVWLNELSPPSIRGTLPGFVYQLGNLIASCAAPLQSFMALKHGGDYGFTLMTVTCAAAIALVILVVISTRARDMRGHALAPGDS